MKNRSFRSFNFTHGLGPGGTKRTMMLPAMLLVLVTFGMATAMPAKAASPATPVKKALLKKPARPIPVVDVVKAPAEKPVKNLTKEPVAQPIENPLKKPVAQVAEKPLVNQTPKPRKPLDLLDQDEPIHISADSAHYDRKKNISEFIGAVKVTQGKASLTADRLKVVFKKEGTTGANEALTPSSADTSIEKVIAEGAVKIKFDNKVAVTERAIYTSDTGILVLSGKGTKVTTGKNSISGTKITVYRNEDRIAVEGGSKQNRVEAVFYTSGQELNLNKGF